MDSLEEKNDDDDDETDSSFRLLDRTDRSYLTVESEKEKGSSRVSKDSDSDSDSDETCDGPIKRDSCPPGKAELVSSSKSITKKVASSSTSVNIHALSIAELRSLKKNVKEKLVAYDNGRF